MSDPKMPQAQPNTTASAGDSVVILDVAAQARAKEAPPAAPPDRVQNEQQRLEDLLPAINEIARKVGGFRRLAEIAHNLDQHRP